MYLSDALCRPPPAPVDKYFSPPYFEWWDRQGEEYVGCETSIKAVEQCEREHGPFDGIIGFSQGACFTAMLASLNEFDHAGRMFPNLKFVMILAGFYPRMPSFRDTHTLPITIPALSVFGKSDFLRDDCLKLKNHFTHLTVVEHHGGHEPPTMSNGSDALVEIDRFLRAFIAQDSAAAEAT